MKLYKCKVRIHGEVKDEVRKKDVTGAEIRVLRKLHGDDAVLEVTETGKIVRTEQDERDRLSQAYGEKVVAELFGMPKAEIKDDIETDEPSVKDDLPLVRRQDSDSLVA